MWKRYSCGSTATRTSASWCRSMPVMSSSGRCAGCGADSTVAAKPEMPSTSASRTYGRAVDEDPLSMTDLAIDVLDVRAEPYAAVPTLVFRLGVTEPSGDPVHAVALRTQIQIEPQRRRYSKEEEARLLELFGEQPQWGDSLRPFLWTHATAMLTGFTGRTEVDLPVTCSYDFEVAGAKYLHSLDDGDIPLALLFSGTVFAR